VTLGIILRDFLVDILRSRANAPLQSLLKRLGYRVQEASSGEEALRLAQGSREKIDLLMTDVDMPGMSAAS
jgi:CheY-like chemotaxis protein